MSSALVAVTAGADSDGATTSEVVLSSEMSSALVDVAAGAEEVLAPGMSSALVVVAAGAEFCAFF